jgi:hypothetical protein
MPRAAGSWGVLTAILQQQGVLLARLLHRSHAGVEVQLRPGCCEQAPRHLPVALLHRPHVWVSSGQVRHCACGGPKNSRC